MSNDTKELVRICEQLPEAKQVEVVDFARFLLAQQGDERWEQIIANPKPRPKLDAFLRESRSEYRPHPCIGPAKESSYA